MKKIIFVCAIAVAAVLTSCSKQETVKNPVVGDIYAEQVEGGFHLVKKYGEQYSPVTDVVFSKIDYDKTLDLVFAYTGKTFDIFTKYGDARGDGGYQGYKVDGDIIHFTKADQTMLYTKKGIVIGTFSAGDFVIDHNKIFTKNPNGLWNLRNLDGDYLTDVSYEKLYVVDMKDEVTYDKLCYRNGAWSLIGSDGGTYDKSSANAAAAALKKKKVTSPVGVLDL